MRVSSWRVVLKFLLQYRRIYALVLAVSVLLALLEALHVALLYPILNSLLNLPAPAGQLGRVGRLLDALLGLVPTENRMVAGCALIIALTPLKGLVALGYEYLVGWASARVFYRTKKAVIERYALAPYQFFLDNKPGTLIECALVSPTRLAFILTIVPQSLVELLRIAAIFAVLLSINAAVTLGLAVLGALTLAAINLVSKRFSYVIGKERVAAGAEQTSVFTEWLSGVKPIWLFGTKSWWLDRFDAVNRRYCDLFVKDSAVLSAPKNIIETFAVTGLFGALLLLKLRSPETLFANLPTAGIFCMALLKMLPSLSNISRGRLQLMGSIADVEDIDRALSAPVQPPARGKLAFSGLKDAVRFKGVSFRYPGRPEVLSGLDLTIERRKTTALVGDSGSGKTTILNLLFGLYEASEGAVWIDDRPLGDYDPRSWLDRVAVVSQDIFVFNGTIRENIVFGRAGYSEQDIVEAAKVACADEFIRSLPDGYQTVVGERGMKISGGQQQRIAIARAVLGRPEILIFDEATSSLDTVSEAAVQQAIAAASRGKTVVAVAHRLSTVQGADTIYVLHAGRVEESGTHEGLIARGGRYARFFDAQARSLESRA